MPSPVDRYYEQVKRDNPSYSDAQAWATAWSIYCKHKNPGSEHCHKDADEYLTKESGEADRTGKNADGLKALVARYRRACGGDCGCGGTCSKSCGCGCHGSGETTASRVASRFLRMITGPSR